MDLSRLDQQELLRLALTAAQQHKHHEAITILQYALNQDSTDAHLHYYIGIEYAHIGHHERALAALECAVLQDPTLEIAIFQLGLLNLTLGRVAQANIAWQGLERFVASEALRLFCDGLRYLILNDPTACRVRLRRGMAINNKNPGLNADIARILDHVESIGMVGRALFPQSYKLPESINSHDGSFFIQGYHTPCNVTVH